MDDTKPKRKQDEEEKRRENEEELEELDDELDEEEQEVKKYEDELKKVKKKNADLEDQLKRAVADYRNLEGRVRDERIEFVKYANKTLLEQLLPAFDTLLLAEKYTKDENLKITVKHLLDVLKTAGIEKVETVGAEYNPSTMEAVEVVEGDKDKVIEEAQPGYLMNGKIIRPARVKVGGIKNN